jgi:hypothetical protein
MQSQITAVTRLSCFDIACSFVPVTIPITPTHILQAPGRKSVMEESAYGRLDAPIGSHVVTPRRGYLHHGIYVGDGKVVHYAGLCYGLHRGPVEEVALTQFADGRPVWIRSDVAPTFDPQETVRRARSRVGEDCYRLLTNNCEHFCEWCLRGTPRSHQIEALLRQPRRALHACLRLFRVRGAPTLRRHRFSRIEGAGA